MIRFNKRGVSTVEYAVLLAFATVVAGCFLPDNFTAPINNVIVKLGYVFDGKKDISNMDAFAQAIIDDKTPIKVKGKTEQFQGIMDLVQAYDYTFSSAALGITTNKDSEMKSEYNGIKYTNYIGAVAQILADNNYVGYDNYTWTISPDNQLYIVDRKLDINNDQDKGTHTVTAYDLTKDKPTPYTETVNYIKGSNGGYFVKK